MLLAKSIWGVLSLTSKDARRQWFPALVIALHLHNHTAIRYNAMLWTVLHIIWLPDNLLYIQRPTKHPVCTDMTSFYVTFNERKKIFNKMSTYFLRSQYAYHKKHLFEPITVPQKWWSQRNTYHGQHCHSCSSSINTETVDVNISKWLIKLKDAKYKHFLTVQQDLTPFNTPSYFLNSFFPKLPQHKILLLFLLLLFGALFLSLLLAALPLPLTVGSPPALFEVLLLSPSGLFPKAHPQHNLFVMYVCTTPKWAFPAPPSLENSGSLRSTACWTFPLGHFCTCNTSIPLSFSTLPSKYLVLN